MSETVVGVDVAKAELVVACRPKGGGWTASNAPEGVAATVARLRSLAPTLIVAEATGGYERALTRRTIPADSPGTFAAVVRGILKPIKRRGQTLV